MRNLEALLELVKPAVVVVRTAEGHGAGFFIDSRGLLVTNRHVVQDARTVTVELFDGSEVAATVVRSLQAPDMAVLRAALHHPCNSLALADDEVVRVGIEVYAIGHPGVGRIDLPYTVTRGIVSGDNRRISGASYIQVDAAINHGNSGGPLVDGNGDVVGMSTMGFVDSNGLNFAVPAASIRTVVAPLVHHFSELATALYCPTCGDSNQRDSRYCSKCGQSFERLPSEESVVKPRVVRSEAQQRRAVRRRCAACSVQARTASLYCANCGARYIADTSDGGV
jgi:serine protease Do